MTSDPPNAAPAVTAPRRTFLLGLAGALAALLMIGIGTIVWLTQGPDGVMAVGGPFTLVDQDNRPVTEKTYRGRHMLVFFGFTFCPDICPTTLNQVADALDRIGPKADRLAPIFITVDPKRDTPDAVKQYVTAFSPRLIGLTGTEEQVAAVARAYRVYFKENRTGPGANDYSMDHSTIMYLMGPDGKFIAPVRANGSGAQLAAELSRYVK